ncbi:MAG: hypothetical protein Kow0063_17530 [Anaerolineae bacterium]
MAMSLSPDDYVSPAAWRSLLFDLLALGVLALATAGFFWQILFAGAWMPAGGGDLASLLYPTFHFAARSLRSGLIPLWNPYLYSGAPFAADIQSSLFYPINLIYFGLAPEISYRGLMWLAIFHFWLAGTGMFLFLRRLLAGASPIPPLFGALAFMFSDYFIVHFGNLNLVAQVAWLPFIFLFYHRSLSERRAGPAVWAGVFLALAASAGHIQPVLIIILGLVGDLLYHLGLVAVDHWKAMKRGLSRRRLWRDVATTLAPLAITLLAGLGLAACVLLPAYEMTGHTSRVDFSYAQASAYSLAPAQLVGLLVPGFFGRDPALHWGAWDRVEVGYLGVLSLLLALFALLIGGYPPSPRQGKEEGSQTVPPALPPLRGTSEPAAAASRNTYNWPFDWLAGGSRRAIYRFACLALLGLLLAMGGYTVLHGWLYGLIPGFGVMRAPARFVFLMDFALASLAALGLDALMRGPEEEVQPALSRLLRVGVWGIAGLLLFALPLAYYAVITSQDSDPVIFARTSAAANGLVFFSGLLIAGVTLLYLRQRRALHPAMIGVLAAGLLFFDLASLGSNVDVGYQDPTRGFEHPAIIRFLEADTGLYRIDTRTDVWHIWQPNTSLLYGIYDVSGLTNPLSLADYQRYLDSIPSRSSPLFDFLNAKYVIAAKDVTLDWEKFAPVFDADPSLNVYLNRDALPRALLVQRAIVVPDHQAALAALRDPAFDPATAVIVEGHGPELAEGGQMPQRPASIGFEVYSPNQIQLRVDTPADAYLVLSEVWYPGWRATVDGDTVPILRANYAFRAVRLEAGQHRVRMTFAPRSWTSGLALTSLTFLVLAGWVLYPLVRWVVTRSPETV